MSQTKIKAGGFDVDVITGTDALTSAPASTDEFLISDAGVLKRIDASLVATSFAGIDDQSSSNDDQLTITDTAVIINEDSDSIDFRVESNGNANMLVVDGSTDCVAIGQAAGDSNFELDIAGDVRLFNSGDGFETIDFDSNRGSAGDFLGDITGKWNGTEVARISLRAGTDTSNKDDGAIHFETSESGGSLGESFKILPNKDIQLGGNTNIGINVTPGDAKFVISEAFANIAGIISNDGSSGGSGETHHIFKRNNSSVGSISATNSSTSFNTSSDYRLKENVTYDWDATTRLKQLKPARFNWIKDDTNTLVDGFIAHEVTAVPEAIMGTKDATETKNNVVLDSYGNMLHHSITDYCTTTNRPE